MSGVHRIRYRFDLPDGSMRQLDFTFDAARFRLQFDIPPQPPFWTELGFSRCANCPLPATTTHCPTALALAPAIGQLEALVSFDTVAVTVVEAERTVHVETSVQQALSSVIGLIMATAGCPWTDHLRPMARFHLPFADQTETLYRTLCMYLVARELERDGKLDGFAALQNLYRDLHVVNRDMSRRLGAAASTDPARNAVALLDTYTVLLPDLLESARDDLKPLFDAWQMAKIPAI